MTESNSSRFSGHPLYLCEKEIFTKINIWVKSCTRKAEKNHIDRPLGGGGGKQVTLGLWGAAALNAPWIHH